MQRQRLLEGATAASRAGAMMATTKGGGGVGGVGGGGRGVPPARADAARRGGVVVRATMSLSLSLSSLSSSRPGIGEAGGMTGTSFSATPVKADNVLIHCIFVGLCETIAGGVRLRSTFPQRRWTTANRQGVQRRGLRWVGAGSQAERNFVPSDFHNRPPHGGDPLPPRSSCAALGGDTGKADASQGAIEGGGRRCRRMRIVDEDCRRESGGEGIALQGEDVILLFRRNTHRGRGGADDECHRLERQEPLSE